jgi:hypothetical protein
VSAYTPIRISEDERIRQARNFFDTHRLRQLRTYFPENSLSDASQDLEVSCWSDPSHILTKLRTLLPFGKVTFPWDFIDFQDRVLDLISSASQEQLLYWHLADAATVNNYPAETVLLWTKDDYFWFIYIPSRHEFLIQQLLAGERLRYLEKFHLNHNQVSVTFQELRLITQGTQHSLVITEGVEFTCRFNAWDNTPWDTTLQNNQPVVNPGTYSLPPSQVDDPELLEFAEAIQEHTNQIAQENSSFNPFRFSPPPLKLPPSSPPSPSTSSINYWGDSPNIWCPSKCSCRKEVCDCGFRPETPPTPPSVVLWAPRSDHLPFRE